MSDRLQELLHQKALLVEHAAWLEREIAWERVRGAPPTDSLVAPPASDAQPFAISGTPTVLPAEPPLALGDTPDATAIGSEAGLDQYHREPRTIQNEVTRGCLLYFVVGLVLFAGSLVALYLVFRHR